MNTKIVVVLVLGIILLGAGALFLIQRNAGEFLPQNQTNNSGPNEPIEPEYRRFLVGTSEISGYSLEVVNEKDFTDIIQGINIYGRTFLHTDDQTTGDKSLENISLSILNEAPAREPDFGTSDYVNLMPGTIMFGFVVNDEDLENPDLPNIILRKLVEYTYRLAFPEAEESEVNEAVSRVYDSLLEKNDSYIVIKQE